MCFSIEHVNRIVCTLQIPKYIRENGYVSIEKVHIAWAIILSDLSRILPYFHHLQTNPVV